MKKILYVLFFLTGFVISGQGQVWLQIEQSFTTEVEKFVVGNRFEFKTKDINGWQQGVIARMLPEPQSLVFDDAIVNLSEISYVKVQRPWATTAGYTLIGFGGAWLVMGGAIEGLSELNLIESQYEFGWDTAAIGAGALLTGYLTKKLFSTAVKKMNDRNRVRIIDVTP